MQDCEYCDGYGFTYEMCSALGCDGDGCDECAHEGEVKELCPECKGSGKTNE